MISPTPHEDVLVKHLLDLAAAGTVVGTLVEVLPAISAYFACLWMLLRIFDLPIVKNSINTLFGKNKPQLEKDNENKEEE